ncbi:hypothetical protein Ddye_022769 [Dipteronia dyeriana]|uniref:Uncharacterized protein n=1 Tax=Dipteronia dyeriana TaxID=168575 RepID=A0AAD9TRV1_9ROSI|nr:hypothetical protein Ddye_022769 [Dipteronia dyeriana]
MGTVHTQPQTHCTMINTFFSSKLSRIKPSIFTHNYCHNATPLQSLTQIRATKASDAAQLKQNWLDSLSFPPLHDLTSTQTDPHSNWALGIDPDLSGALAVLKTDHSGCSAQVFDSPHLPVLISGRVRKRLDAKSIVMLLRGLDAPIGIFALVISGTTAYIEQSIPYPKDGKQGWWSGGFGYGLWIGILVASGFSVVPVPSLTWKNEFEISGGSNTKDDSRRVASSIFPSLSSLLQRKKDHGRAEALLIAAYGKGLKLESSSEELVLNQESCIGSST